MARNVSNDTGKTIGETIRQLRQEKLWTQADLASRIETTTISVGRWEKNSTRPSLHFQQRLCDIFARSPEELGFLPQQGPEYGEGSAKNDQHQEVVPDRQEQAAIHKHAQSGSPSSVSDRQEQAAIHEHAQSSSPSLVPDRQEEAVIHEHAHRFAPPRREPIYRNILLRPRVSLLFVMVCLSIFLLLGGVFFYKQDTLSSASPRPSCQTPSSHEGTMTIYNQVMCKQASLSFALDRQDALRWDENNECAFTHGAYHVLLPSTAYVAECFAHAAPLSQNFALQIEITVLKGYSGGVVFDAEGPSTNWDVVASRLPIDIWGTYNFYLGNTNVTCHLSKDPNDLNYCHSPHGTITYGIGATNTVTIVALGSLIYFYANGFFIDQARAPASSPSTGFFGVFANGSLNAADVAFSHLQIWDIS